METIIFWLVVDKNEKLGYGQAKEMKKEFELENKLPFGNNNDLTPKQTLHQAHLEPDATNSPLLVIIFPC